jgi:hypothetical protein
MPTAGDIQFQQAFIIVLTNISAGNTTLNESGQKAVLICHFLSFSQKVVEEVMSLIIPLFYVKL